MSEIFTFDNVRFLAQGLGMTIMIALITIVLSIFFGSILAIAKNYGNKFFSKLASAYIELFRCTPNLLWILAIRFMVPIPPLASGVLSFTLFTTAVVAEIIRGGLNSIPKGQFEGAASQGFTFVQTLWYIVLPQCFMKIVPSLLSQMITIIKDTSFLWAVAIEEFTGKSMILMGQLRTGGQVLCLFAVIAGVYFLLNFTLSCVVRKRQEKSAI
ncbi:MAG: amino acid ABC transporter permease [Oscillospiraceae bacterium]|nr:amino acid ABC transporter permease [Oscillospiraceae bacterium]